MTIGDRAVGKTKAKTEKAKAKEKAKMIGARMEKAKVKAKAKPKGSALRSETKASVRSQIVSIFILTDKASRIIHHRSHR